jgi:hypothetical protein
MGGKVEGVSPTEELAETWEEMADKRVEALEGAIVCFGRRTL